jgi:hypothetical protein
MPFAEVSPLSAGRLHSPKPFGLPSGLPEERTRLSFGKDAADDGTVVEASGGIRRGAQRVNRRSPFFAVLWWATLSLR